MHLTSHLEPRPNEPRPREPRPREAGSQEAITLFFRKKKLGKKKTPGGNYAFRKSLAKGLMEAGLLINTIYS